MEIQLHEETSDIRAEVVEIVFDLIEKRLLKQIKSSSASHIAAAKAILRAEVEALAKRPITNITLTRDKEVVEIKGKMRHKTYPELLRAIAAKQHVWLHGPAGTGKTTAAIHVAEDMGVPFHSWSFSSMTTPSQLLGYRDAGGNYVSTSFREAFEFGGVFLADEIDSANPNALAVLNMGLSVPIMSFPDGQVRRHPDFTCIACANTAGLGSIHYSARNIIDRATIDRFVFLDWEEDRDFFAGIPKDWVAVVDAVRAEFDKSSVDSVYIGPRAYIQGAALISSGFSHEEALFMAVVKTDDQDIKRLATRVYADHFKIQIDDSSDVLIGDEVNVGASEAQEEDES